LTISKVWDYCTDNIAVAPAYNPLVKGIDYSGLAEELETYYYHLTADNWNQYNTGVFLFNKSENNTNLFRLWHEEWYRFRDYENMAFNRLCLHELEYTNLPSTYNQFYPDKNGDSILVHYIGWCKKYLIN
jgi:hypothetical protein